MLLFIKGKFIYWIYYILNWLPKSLPSSVKHQPCPPPRRTPKFPPHILLLLRTLTTFIPCHWTGGEVAWVSPRTVRGAANLQQQLEADARGGNAARGTKADTSPLSPCQSCTAQALLSWVGCLLLITSTAHPTVCWVSPWSQGNIQLSVF